MICPGGGAEQKADNRIVIDFWHAMGGAEHSAALNKFVHDFEQQNPDIHIVQVYQGNYGQLSQKLIASVIARDTPVMAQMYENWTTRFIARGLLDPVENYFNGPDGLTRQEIEDIWEPFRRNNTWNGKMVTLPFNKSCYVLYINENMLHAAGYTKPPETWDELRAAARKMTVRQPGKSTPSVFGFMERAQIEAFSVLLFRAGESYLSPDDKTVTVDTPMALQTLQLLHDMIQDDRSMYIDSTSYPAIPFGSGKVAMYIFSSAAFPFNDTTTGGKFQWIAAPLPHPAGCEGGILFQGTNIGIFGRGHSPEQRRAAWRFLKFITNTENAARWSIATGYVAVRKSSIETPEMKKFLAAHPNYNVPIKLIPQAVFDPRPSYWDEMRPQIASYAIEAMNGQRTPEESLAIIAKTLRGIIAYETR